MNEQQIDQLAWEKMGGLLPAVVQDVSTGQVLMVGYMDRHALERTLAEGQVVFFSRSKNRPWKKGDSSGHVLNMVAVEPDCDNDALLVKARPHGPTCHQGTVSCFGHDDAPGLGFLGRLEGIVSQRRQAPPKDSYTARLFQKGVSKIAQKVGEEGVEVALAAKEEGSDELKEEAADLLYHLVVLLEFKGLHLQDAVDVLRQRNEER